MRCAGFLALLCGLAASPASAQAPRAYNCANFLDATHGQRAQYAALSEIWAAGFAQAKTLSCFAAAELPDGPPQDRHELVECRSREASTAYLALPIEEKIGRIERLCRAHPENDLAMTTLLIFADINSAANRAD